MSQGVAVELARNEKVALFVGAHPDDIEIGAGATVARLAAQDWTVWLLILTSEQDEDIAQTRKLEALGAAQVLGVARDRVMFADFSDASLTCDGASVEQVRRLLGVHGVDPDVVFTHTYADSHKDHREANEITRATFRRRPILGFGVVNSLTRSKVHQSAFQPRIYVDVTETYGLKKHALHSHVTQKNRIDTARIDALYAEYGSSIGAEYSESFDLLIQEDSSPGRVRLALELNHSSFHKFWSTVLDNRELVIIHAAPVYRAKREGRWQSDKDREGISLLYRTFNELWEGRLPLADLSCKTSGVEAYLENEDILLSGGAVSNSITREYFNHFDGVRYVIDYTMPDYTDIRIRDRLSEESIRADYEAHQRLGTINVIRDVGILTVMPSPVNRQRAIIGCMGIHGFGTLGCFRYLTDPVLLRELVAEVDLPLAGLGYQVLIDYDIRNELPMIRPGSFHSFES
ncbi:PIG-L family deacetylase [Actinomadura soli]|uniref:PIG-L family deacetylase n=1 Tax=Actinomadura soli TaxID=2508997 RepID=A0A5C4J900_9ACTN|nr:PIG-L deacetylase family protein [Actinomadura soli]TMQ96805.1 PIG-L family deacetylase [Actinomadura soli]